MKILAFAASHRPESLNKKLALLASKKVRELGVEVDFAEYGEFDMPLYNDTISGNPPASASIFAKRAKDVDGIIIALPEYNWSFPANLKNIIDWTSIIKPAPLAGKTVFLMSATTGGRGGILGLQQIKPPLEHLGMFICNRVSSLAHAHNAFSENGEFMDKAQDKLLTATVSDFVDFTNKIQA